MADHTVADRQRFGRLRDAVAPLPCQTLQRPPRPPATAQSVQSAIARDREEPRFVILDGGRTRSLAHRDEERLLHQIICKRTVVEYVRQKPAELSLVALEQLFDLDQTGSVFRSIDAGSLLTRWPRSQSIVQT